VQEAARSLGVQIFVLNAGTENEIDAAFTKLVEQRAGALMLVSDTFFTSQRSHLATLSTYLRIPTLDAVRESRSSISRQSQARRRQATCKPAVGAISSWLDA
jgi:hypothetical protein